MPGNGCVLPIAALCKQQSAAEYHNYVSCTHKLDLAYFSFSFSLNTALNFSTLGPIT